MRTHTRSGQKRRQAWGVMLLLPIVLLGGACGIFDAPPPLPRTTPTADNLLSNPRFEDGDTPWIAGKQAGAQGFTVSDTVAHSGSHSLSLRLDGDASATGTGIAGASQTINPQAFPDYISGYFRVDEWRSSATFQYLEFVISVRGGDFGDDIDVHELRFPLGGLDRQPPLPPNVQYLFLARAQPVLHQWVYFDYPLTQAFTRAGKLPTRWTSIDVRFEARYDAKTAEQPATSAQVYFDDLYAGPQANNPNRPPAP